MLSGKETACQAGDPGSIPGSGRAPKEVYGNPLQDSCLGNPMDRGTWPATIHGVAKSRNDLATKQQQWRCRHRKQTCGHTGRGEGGTSGESRVRTYAWPHVKRTAGGSLRKERRLGLCDHPEGRDWAGGGRQVQAGGVTCACDSVMLLYGRNQHNTVKQ